MIIEEVLQQRIQGVKNEKGIWITPAFPKLIYVLDKDNITEDSKYWYLTELAAKCTAKRMVPDYISAKVMRAAEKWRCLSVHGLPVISDHPRTAQRNPDGSKKISTDDSIRVLSQSTWLMLHVLQRDISTGSGRFLNPVWSFVTGHFDADMSDCLERYPMSLQSCGSTVHSRDLKKGETIDKLLFNGYSTISLGYAGLCEMCVRMTGKTHTSPEGKKLALEVMQKLNDKCKEWKEAENISYSVYGTPMESTTYKFAKCLQKRFGIIKGVTDKNYITNSYHIHVTEPVNAFDKLKFESEFQKLSPGGAISYVEVPNLQDNVEAVISVMKFIYDNILYAELNTKSDYCEICGYDGEIKIVTDENGKLIWECPNCGNRDQNNLFVARRTCGYIGTQFWNQGRTQEIKDRVLHL